MQAEQELSDAEWLRRIRLKNRQELGLEGPQGVATMDGNVNGIGDFMYMNAAAGGVPSPEQDLLAYYAGRQGGNADGWQPSMIDPRQGTYHQMQMPTHANYVGQEVAGQAVSGLGYMGAVGVSADQKAQATLAVEGAIRESDLLSQQTNNVSAARLILEAQRSRLSSLNWTDSSWGVVGPRYSSRADLLKKLTEAQARVIARSGAVREDGKAIFDPRSVNPTTGKARVDSQIGAAAGSLVQSGKETAAEVGGLLGSLSKVTQFFLGSPTRILVTTSIGLGVYGLVYTDLGKKISRKVFGSKKKNPPARNRHKKAAVRKNPSRKRRKRYHENDSSDE